MLGELSVAQLLREEQVVARGDDAVQARPPRDPVVGVDLVVTPRIVGEHEVGLVQADRAADLFTKRHRPLELAVVMPQEYELPHADRLAGGALLLLPDPGQRVRRHLRIVSALVTAREGAVRDVRAALDEARERSRAAEVDVIGVGEDGHRALRDRECFGHRYTSNADAVARTDSYSSAIFSPTLSQVKCSARSRAPCARCVRSRWSVSTCAIASASASSSPGGTRRPDSPSSMSVCRPPTRVPTTGVPQAIASRATRPNDSVSEGTAQTSAAA